ncbi:MAG: MASE2 domain-containing protein, partial [Burkholderiales bacterium]
MSNDAMPIREPLAPDEVRRFVRRSHGLRTIGLALGSVMVGSVLYGLAAPISVWILLVLHGLAWPHLVRMIVRRSDQPVVVDQRCFMADTAMGGLWIALMQFNLLPSVVLVTAYSMSLIAAGGGKRLTRGLGLMALTCAVAALADGLAFAPATGMAEILGSIP